VAFIDGGKLERVDLLSAITSGSGRTVYTLKRRPDDLTALERLERSLSLSWDGDSGALTAVFSEDVPPETVNAKLLPELLAFGVVSVVSGRSLAEAYLSVR
jgi:hypothetical protein